MAATQKESTRRKPRKSAAKKTAGRDKHPAQRQRPIRREAGALICFLLAFFSAFGYVGADGLFIAVFCGIMKGLLGYGFWLVPPALLFASILLLFHRGLPVKGRVWCCLLLPLFFAAFLGLFSTWEDAEWSLIFLEKLWDSGVLMDSGGVLGGILTFFFQRVFSVVGAGLIFGLTFLLLLLGACNRTVVDIVDAFRNRIRAEYEPEEILEKTSEPKVESKPNRNKRAHRQIDIPVDDGPENGPKRLESAEETLAPAEERPLFDSVPGVPRPDELLRRQTEEASGSERDMPAREEPSGKDGAFLPDVIKESTACKIKPEEAVAALVEVAQEIESARGLLSLEYTYPPAGFLLHGEMDQQEGITEELRRNQERLSETLRSFGIDANIVGVTRGPSVTRYELELDQGVRLNKLTNLADDIALSLGAAGVRIAPIPNQISMVGIEVPNKLVTPVNLHDVIVSKEFASHSSKVAFALGRDIGNHNIVSDISKMPHLLIAGTTGSGKSVCTNSLIISLLYKAKPEEVRLIMIDPKMVELSIYNGIPHLLIPVVTDPKKAAGALQWAVTEMMKRYRIFSEAGVRDLASYNRLAQKGGEKEHLPQIVVVIDELADLMLVAAKEVEESICRVAQMGRASGMHLIIATQRPSADVITGLMKANIPSRIAFAVASALESRIILDTQGAEKLVGRGDMLYFPLGAGKPQRVQGCLITDSEVSAVVEHVKKSAGQAEYSDQIMMEIEQHAAEREKGAAKGFSGGVEEGDELFPQAVEIILETGQASVSMLQRRLKLGYARAARLVDQMEEAGIVGPPEGAKPRQVLVTKQQWAESQPGAGEDADTLLATDSPDGGEDLPFDLEDQEEE